MFKNASTNLSDTHFGKVIPTAFNQRVHSALLKEYHPNELTLGISASNLTYTYVELGLFPYNISSIHLQGYKLEGKYIRQQSRYYVSPIIIIVMEVCVSVSL